jgi:hypothetical protein
MIGILLGQILAIWIAYQFVKCFVWFVVYDPPERSYKRILNRNFVLVTKSESGDDYIYFLKDYDRPSNEELEMYLNKHGNDIDNGYSNENIVSFNEIPNEFKPFKL